MSRSIKMEEDDYPLSSPDLDQAIFNHCLTTFYDQDSQEIIQAKYSAQDVFDMLEHSLDLCDAPLGDIMRVVEQNTAFRGVDAHLVRNKVIRHKRLLKRLRAKSRQPLPRQQRTVLEVPSSDFQEEYKKQRNRISAQISRDRKKERVKALEELNQQLQEECERQRIENEQLRAQVQEAAQTKQLIGPFSSKEGGLKNRITKLLVFLGIIFLFGLIRDILSPQSASVLPLNKINNLPPSYVLPSYSQQQGEDGGKMMDALEQSISEVVEHRGLVASIKERVMRQAKNWGEQTSTLTPAGTEQLQLLQRQALW